MLDYFIFKVIYDYEASEKKKRKEILTNQLSIMMNRLWFIISCPSAILALLFGTWLLILVPSWLYENWMIAKLIFVLGLILYHIKTHFIFKELQLGVVNYSSDFMRIWNEVTSVILVSVVFLVVLKNTVNWTKFTAGTIVFIILILVLIKLYKRIRN